MSAVPKLKGKQQLDPECAAYMRREALKELAWARWRLRLPDDHHGRAMLRAMLLAGMSRAEVGGLCPWLSFAELQGLVQWADDQDPKHWNSDRFGELVELTDNERETLRLWPFRPCDVEWSVVQERYRTRRNAKAQERRRKQREMVEMAMNEPMRDESLLFLIGTDGRWTFANKLPDRIEGGVAWRSKQDGRPLTGKSLKARVYEALDRLEARGMIVSKYGGAGSRLVQRRELPSSKKPHLYAYNRSVPSRNADGSGTSGDAA